MSQAVAWWFAASRPARCPRPQPTSSTDPEVLWRISAMQAALTAEIALAKRLYPLARSDARIGFEAANHYFYRPLDLVEKVISCAALERKVATSDGK
jgi:hypothetical protein